jgi:hypothetical protein
MKEYKNNTGLFRKIKKHKEIITNKNDKNELNLKKIIKVNKNTGPFYTIQDAINMALPNSIIKVPITRSAKAST